MRTLLIGTLAATLVGCSCLLPPQASMEACTDANGFACYDRTAASQPVEPKPASFKTDSATIEIKSTIAAKTENPLSADARDRAHLSVKTAKSTMIAAKAGGAVANSNTRTIQDQLAAATAVAELMTFAPVVPAPESKVNNKDRSNHSETVLRGDAETSATASPNNTDLLVALLMARPEIKSVSDLTSKMIATDERHSASNGIIRTAIAAAGAAEVQLSEGQAKAIDRLISGCGSDFGVCGSGGVVSRNRRLQDISNPALASFIEGTTGYTLTNRPFASRMCALIDARGKVTIPT